MIPRSTNRAHLPSRNKRNDTVAVLNMAARRRPGRRFADLNVCPSLEEDWNLHWKDGPRKNHFTHILDKDTGKRRRMTHTELHRPVAEWRAADVRRWRRRVGLRWVRPFTVAERQRQARRRRVVICWELKDSRYGGGPGDRIVSTVTASAWPAYYMTLVNMRGWGRKLRRVHMAGGETALLTHGCRKPDDYATWAPYVDRLWPAKWGRGHSRLGAS